MKTDEVNLRELLENSRLQLTKPFAKTQRKLLFLLNITYLCLAPLFLISEKLATGHFVPNTVLGIVYGLVGCTNLLSAGYTYLLLTDRILLTVVDRTIRLSTDKRIESVIRWCSVVSIMVMSFCNMSGLGNPSGDAILTDFALGHTLIVLAAMLLGRSASFVWFAIVIGLLFYVTFVQKGYQYQYNYLTPAESVKYQTALKQSRPWAVARAAELRANGLNPPRVSRYFNTWFIFILIAFLTAYYFLGIPLDVLKIIPSVTADIKDAIDATSRQELERHREKNQAEEQKLLLKQEALSAELKNLKAQINPHFLYNTLNYFYIKSSHYSEDLAEAILKLSGIMRYSMQVNLNEVNASEEIKYMNQFIALHQLRFKNKLFINIAVDGPIGQKKIPPFLFIELVENAFKHGNMTEPENPLVISIQASPDKIVFCISNRKNKKKRVESTKIGLSNLQRRLYLTYQENGSFSITEDDDNFSCKLSIKA